MRTPCKLGAARTKALAAWRLIELAVPKRGASFTYQLDRNKLRQVRRREGRYLLRTNFTESEPRETLAVLSAARRGRGSL
jgi:hypothetical protein